MDTHTKMFVEITWYQSPRYGLGTCMTLTVMHEYFLVSTFLFAYTAPSNVLFSKLYIFEHFLGVSASLPGCSYVCYDLDASVLLFVACLIFWGGCLVTFMHFLVYS